MRTPSPQSLVARTGPWAGATLLVLLAVVALYFFTGAAAGEPSQAPEAGAGDIASGPADAPLTVIVYSDFQCPFCAQYAPIIERLREKYGDEVRFVYRFYPLSTHDYATISAKVAYAAHLQGRFWEMHDLLFEHQEEWAESDDPRPYFDAYAESLGLDLDRFHADADAQSTTDVIERQAAEGTAAGVTHTPWVVIGDTVVLPRSFDEFDKLIREAL